MNNESIFRKDLASPPDFNDVASYEYQTIYPINGLSDFNQYKSVRFNLLQQNLLLHLRNGFIEVTGQILKAVSPHDQYTATDVISFCHNGGCFMFSEATLSISGQIVENVSFLGQASTMLHSALFSHRSDGLSFSWVPDTAANTESEGFKTRKKWFIDGPREDEDKGRFSIKIPLHVIFGFCERFQLFSGYGLEICLARAGDSECLIRSSSTAIGELNISSIRLSIPIVQPSDEVKLKLNSELRENREYQWTFRKRSMLMQSVPDGLTQHQLSLANTSFEERPLFVLVAFQKDKVTDQKGNNAIFKPNNVESIVVKQNSVQYPRNINEADFPKNNFGLWYEAFVNFRAQYLQYNGQYNPTTEVTPSTFKSLYTIFIVDCSKSESVISRNVQTEVCVKFREATPKNLRVYILHISERTLNLSSAGDSMVIR